MPVPLHLLILEDCAADAELLQRELQRAGFAPQTHCVETQADFLRCLAGQPDIILADYTLPQYGALEALQALQEHNLDIPCIIVTGTLGEEAVAECMKRGAADYLLKDRLARLGSAVTRALHEKQLRDEKRRAEIALRESEARFRLLAENAQDIIYRYRLTAPAGMEYISPVFTTHTGYAPEACYADPDFLLNIVPPEDREQQAAFMRGQFPPGTPLSQRWQCRDGKFIWIEQRGTPIYDANGKLIALEGIARNITSYKEAEEQLRLQATALEAAANGIVITDRLGVILWVNPAFTQLTGYTPQEVYGQDLHIVKPSEHAPVFYRNLWQIVMSGQVWQGEIVNWRKDGTPYHEAITITAVRDAHGEITNFVAIRQDNTSRKRAEAALASANTDLAQAVRRANQLAIAAEAANHAKGEFLANTSHELRTPLSSIIGSLNMVLEDLCDSAEEEREFVLIAYKAARNLLDTINAVLDLAKIEAGKMTVDLQAVDVLPVLQEACTLIRAQAEEKKLYLEIKTMREAVPPVHADPDRLHQIVLNLLGNAIKFTEHGGVTICVEADAAAGWMQIVIQDTGIGIAPAAQTRLFQPFVQADGSTTRKYGGTGLGLSISRRLAELMDGSLTLYSAGEGRGSTLTLTLPLAAQPQEHGFSLPGTGPLMA